MVGSRCNVDNIGKSNAMAMRKPLQKRHLGGRSVPNSQEFLFDEENESAL
jgi:hypothetical protein